MLGRRIRSEDVFWLVGIASFAALCLSLWVDRESPDLVTVPSASVSAEPSLMNESYHYASIVVGLRGIEAQGAPRNRPKEGETLIGRWCDRMLPGTPRFNGIMSIVVADDGSLHLKLAYREGEPLIRELREAGGGVYHVVDSQAGDRYRIVQSTGNLQLLDGDGLIRVAARLENAPQDGECTN